MDAMYDVLGIFIATCILNIPFGMLRSRQRPYTFLWFLYIHLPVPFIFMVRHFANISYFYIPLFMFAAMIGQYIGCKRR